MSDRMSPNWPKAAVVKCQLLRRCWTLSGHSQLLRGATLDRYAANRKWSNRLSAAPNAPPSKRQKAAARVGQ